MDILPFLFVLYLAKFVAIRAQNATAPCIRYGRFPIEDVTCQSYYLCYWSGGAYQKRIFKCPTITVFDPARELCVLPTSYSCGKATSTTKTTASTTRKPTTPKPTTSSTTTKSPELTTVASTVESTTKTTAETTIETTTTTASTTLAPCSCNKIGRFPIADATCQRYYLCYLENGAYVMRVFKCPNALLFDPDRQLCVLPASPCKPSGVCVA